MSKIIKNNFYELLKIIVCGFIIGVAGIIPGLSGAVLTVSLGIYPKLINSVINLRSEFRKSASYLLPFGISALLGMFLFGVVMKPLFENFEHSIIWLFMGLIVGSTPSFLKEANQDGFRIAYTIPMVITFILGLVLTTLTEHTLNLSASSPVMMFISGAILAIGSIIPGISSSLILMQFGVYDEVISAFVTPDWFGMLWVSVGAVSFFITSVKFVNMMFEKMHGYAYFAAFGFLLSTVVAAFPGITRVTDVVLFIVGAILIYKFNIITKNNIVHDK